jgi:hypothetical protein
MLCLLYESPCVGPAWIMSDRTGQAFVDIYLPRLKSKYYPILHLASRSIPPYYKVVQYYYCLIIKATSKQHYFALEIETSIVETFRGLPS